MTNCIKIWCLMLLMLGSDFTIAAGSLPTNHQSNILEIQSLAVEDKSISLSQETKIRLKPYSKGISIFFGPSTNSTGIPVRLHYKLDGYDRSWREDGGEMCLMARFYDESKNQIEQKKFSVNGHSAGWQQGLKDSSLTHRQETLVVPPRTSQLMIIIASTGAPSTVGVYALTDLIVSRISKSDQLETLLQFPFDQSQKDYVSAHIPYDWVRDGTHPSMAKIVELGKDSSPKKAYAILDDDLTAHAEWHNFLPDAPHVKPGDNIVIEWNEMYDIADGLTRVAKYESLPPGQYHFQVAELTAMGVPTGVEASLPILVLQPIWKRPWFWILGFIGFCSVITASVRYSVRRKMQHEILCLKNQRMLEHERLRIARDIHDDFGARVTQISLISAMAHNNLTDLNQARADFEQISQMSRDLVAALYETVWVVNPANDNVKELRNHLFHITNKLCEKAQCRCRFYADNLPPEIAISSHIRHNICLAVKEALNNVIKHASASEVVVRIVYKEFLLDISIQDNGCGFQTAGQFAGAGLINLKQRLNNMGGICIIESQPGHGTTIHLRLKISALAS